MPEDRLKRISGRYVRAVQEVMIDERTLSGSVDDVLVISKAYGALMENESSIMQEAQVKIRVQITV